ncbi:MAG: 16S rRNA (uracil(1498)-N(3))-methyltransferase [Thermosediminibacteraceae bacterium]|nr:16S rRNA (uracil(1498)-N(3))-methyltransferase [Thermosediminibacteraceae bacterium]
MPIFFVCGKINPGDVVEISGEDAHHITKVLRMAKGEFLNLSNGVDSIGKGQILELIPESCKIKVKVIEKTNFEPKRPRITLFQGVPKGQKFDFILQKNTELGVAEFVPVITERTVVEIDDKKSKKKVERWQKIVKEAAKQCCRPDLPVVHEPVDFDECIKLLKKYPLVLVPWEEEREVFLKQILSTVSADLKDIAVLIGPEGGLSKEEIEKVKKSGAITVSLGPRILRTETAGFAVTTILMYEMGDLGEVMA